MPNALLRRGDTDALPGKIGKRLFAERFAVVLDMLWLPFEQLSYRCLKHGQQREVAMLAYFVPQCSRLVSVLIIDEVGEVLGMEAVHPVFFQRLSFIEGRAKVGHADGVGSHEPFVSTANQGIGLYFPYGERQGPHGLGTINRHPGTCLSAPLTDCFEVQQGAVCPVDMACAHQPGFAVDGFEDGLGPCFAAVGTRRSGHPAQLGTALFAKAHPGVDIARELFLTDDDVFSFLQGQVMRHYGHAITHGGNQNHLLCIRAVNQGGEVCTQAFRWLKEV